MTCMYQLNKTEIATVQKYRDAIKLVFNDAKIIRQTYCFTGTGIGTVVEVEFTIYDPTLNAQRVFRYEVTDYDSW